MAPVASPVAPPPPCDNTAFGTVRDAQGGVIAGAKIGAAESDADGHFRLCLAPGETTVTASVDGYGSLSARRNVAGKLLLDFALAPEATLVGQVVMDESGRPVPGATVFDYAEARDAAFAPAPHSTTTDAEGRFRIAGAAAGAHRLGAHTTDAVAEQARVVVGAGETAAPVVLRLRDAPRIEGVLRSEGRPVGGAEIEAYGGGSPSRPDTTDPDGRFVLHLVPAEAVTFRVVGYQVVSPESLDVDRPVMKGITVEVQPERSDPSYPDAPIAGGDLTLGGVVLDGNGEGLPLVAVQASGPTRRAGTMTDLSGAFSIAGLAPGSYALRADDPILGHGSAFASAGDGSVRIVLASAGALEVTLEGFRSRPSVFAFLEGTEGENLRVATQSRIDDLPAGSYLVVAQSDSEGRVERASVAGGETSKLVLRTGGTASVRGTAPSGWRCVVLPTLPDVADVPGNVDWSTPVVVRPDGRFSFERAPAGDIDVWCQGRTRPFPVMTARLHVEPGGIAEVTLHSAR